MSDPHALYAKSAEYAQAVLGQINADCLDNPSACDGWDVREAVNHLVGGQMYFGMTARGETPPDGAEAPDMSAQAVAMHAAAVAGIKQAYTPEVLEKMLPGPRGDMPGAMFLGIATMENTLHAWDIAKGAGIDAAIPDDLAGEIHGIVGMLAEGGRGDAFADAVAVADDASPSDKLVALSGRQP